MREEIQWVPVGERLPTSDETVLICAKDTSEPVWIGFYDGSPGWAGWWEVDGSRAEVTHWAPMPKGFAR